METRMTVIVDNTADGGLAGEWGLCILIEYRDKKILLDAGASELFSENMEKLGYAVPDVDFAVLSHAHYDHANGMPCFFRKNDRAKFYVRDAVKPDCYEKKNFFYRKYIGIPKTVLQDFPDRIEYVNGDLELTEGVWLIPHKTPGMEKIGKREKMMRLTPGGWKTDDFAHEQSLVIDTDKGLVILNSCSHGGAVNIINEVRATFPDKHVYGIIGGFHLYNKTEKEVRAVAESMKKTGIEFICTGHCTKDVAYGILKEELGDRLCQLRVGLKMTF